MISKVFTSIPYGFDGRIIEVECAITQGLPRFDIVGMANKTISEARQRVRSAIKNAGLKWPDSHITVNLAPAELAKGGVFFDIPIAISILVASNQLTTSDVKNRIFTGELALDGTVRPIRGILNILEAGKSAHFKEFFIPSANLSQAALIDNITVSGFDSLTDLIQILKQQKPAMSPPKITLKNVVKNNKTDTEEPFLCDIYGQELAKRALIIAIAGRHNLILSGPPGAGKTLLARAARNLMPDLTKEEIIAITKIHSLTQDITSVITKRPFRSPHHTSSILSLIGGGNHLNPGEISLSHLGILYLDELPEYKRETLEALRQPLEDKKISLARANARYTYPSDFMLLATMNPCPCGYLGDKTHVCKCKPSEIKRYKDKLSGPLLDRIDLRIAIERTDSKELCIKKLTNDRERKHNQNVVKNTITEAIRRQHARYKDQTTYNSNLTSSQIVKKINLTNSAKSILNQASEKLNLSARSYFKVIKVAQTIADLEEENCVNDAHILEALSYRMDL